VTGLYDVGMNCCVTAFKGLQSVDKTSNKDDLSFRSCDVSPPLPGLSTGIAAIGT
jgi:hypothetical protein